MDIVKLIGIGLIALVIIIIVKQYKPEFAIYVSLAAGILILGMTFDTISQIVGVINDYTNKASINNKFVIVLLKITGIAILAEAFVKMQEKVQLQLKLILEVKY